MSMLKGDFLDLDLIGNLRGKHDWSSMHTGQPEEESNKHTGKAGPALVPPPTGAHAVGHPYLKLRNSRNTRIF